MSRKSAKFASPVLVFDTEVDEIHYGLDHSPIIGYFIQGYLQGRCVLDRDGGGMGCVPHPLSTVPMPRGDLGKVLQDLGLVDDANSVFLDMPI